MLQYVLAASLSGRLWYTHTHTHIYVRALYMHVHTYLILFKQISSSSYEGWGRKGPEDMRIDEEDKQCSIIDKQLQLHILKSHIHYLPDNMWDCTNRVCANHCMIFPSSDIAGLYIHHAQRLRPSRQILVAWISSRLVFSTISLSNTYCKERSW